MVRKTKYNIGLFILAAAFEMSALTISSLLFGIGGLIGSFIGIFAMLLYFLVPALLENKLGIEVKNE